MMIQTEYFDNADNVLQSESNFPEINSKFTKYCFATSKQDSSIPTTQKEAYESVDAKLWKAAEKYEMDSLLEMEVYDKLHDSLPSKDIKPINCRWVYAIKRDAFGNVLKYKARLVAKGFMEKFGIDYEDIFAPVANFNTIRTAFAIAAAKNWTVYQDDQKTAFLNASLEKAKWIKLPDGKVALITKALYGLKESPREWFKTYLQFMIEEGFTQSKVDPCLFFKRDILVNLYVDDTLSTGVDSIVKLFRQNLRRRFKCGSGGIADHYLAIHVTQTPTEISLDQSQYIKDKLEEFAEHLGPNHQQKCSTPLLPQFQNLLIEADESGELEPEFPYRKMVGALVYLMVCTRFDIAAAVSVVSKYLHQPKKIHCDIVRKIYLYLRGTTDYALTYRKNGSTTLKGFCDASFANLESYKSLSGHVFQLGELAIIWSSCRQPIVVKSTQEAEYVALTPAMQDCLWATALLEELGFKQESVEISEDNEACIALANNPQSSKRTRHIQVRYHWIRQHLESKIATLKSCRTADQLADIFTKGLHGPNLKTFCLKLGLGTTRSMKQGEN